jgi:hypothetical protein
VDSSNDPILWWFCGTKGCNHMKFAATNDNFILVNKACPKCFVGVKPETYYDVSCWEMYPEIFSKLITTQDSEFKTQKAIGLRELRKTLDGQRIQSFGLVIPDYVVVTKEADFNKLQVETFCKHHRLFARPCPKTPRHGFLDSRQVKSIAEARELFKQMKLIDEESELVLMPYIDASHNAVITNTTAAIGLGHDGATAGKKAISLPVHGELRTKKDSKSITESAYLECVYDKAGGSHNIFAVQLRNGPELPRTKDIVSIKVVVSEIIDVEQFTPKDDLLAWEKLCQEIQADQINGKRLGVVIVHERGCIGSHFSVHAVINKIPFITSHRPTIGEVIEPTAINPVDYRQVKKGIELGLSKEFTKLMLPLLDYYGSDSHSSAFKGMVYTSLYALHGYSVAGREESKLLGLGIASLIRVSVCAALGEARHHKGITSLQGNMLRDKVYRKYFEDIFAGIKKLQITEQIFADGSWSDSYGGKNWASCTRATIKLVNKAIIFVRKANDDNFRKLMEQFNKLINEVHNGGKFLNKFVPNKSFDQAANDLALFVAVRANELYSFIDQTKQLDESIEANGLSGMKQLRKMTKKDQQALQEITDAVGTYDNNNHDDDDDREPCECKQCNPD